MKVGPIQLIDTHCHLYLQEFSGDFPEMIKRAENKGITHFCLPAIDSTHLESMLALEKHDPARFRPMIGLHPCSVTAHYNDELDLIERLLSTRSFIAIGEIGLDYYWDKTYVEHQIYAFKQQIEWAISYKLPIVIHSRQAIDPCIDIVRQYVPRGLTGVFHCFSGNKEQAEAIVEVGFFLGIGGVVTYKNSGLPEVVRDVPIESMVLETDAPYLTPVPYRGKRNESSYLELICKKLAEVKGITHEEVAAITTANAQKIFRI